MSSITAAIYSHLQFRLEGNTAADICENFSDDVVILSSYGRFYGHEGVQQSAALLAEDIPGSTFTYRQTLIEGDFAFLEWAAENRRKQICDGADSFVVAGGRIVLQTIHYSIEPH